MTLHAICRAVRLIWAAAAGGRRERGGQGGQGGRREGWGEEGAGEYKIDGRGKKRASQTAV